MAKKPIKGIVSKVQDSTRSPGIVYVYIDGVDGKKYSKRTQHVEKDKATKK